MASPRGTTAATGDTRALAEIVRDRLVGTNNGLEIRRWTVPDATSRSMSALAEFSEGSPLSEAVAQRLRRNGLRLARVPADRLDDLMATLGGATLDRTEWHGQVYDWRSLRDQPIESRGTAIAIDGRVRRFQRGEFRLLIRGWTLMMEDGPYFHLEMQPQYRLPRQNDLQRALGRVVDEPTESFASVALDMRMQSGCAYVLVSEPPTTDWPAFDRPATALPNLPSTLRQVAAGSLVETLRSGAAPAAATPAQAPTPRSRVGPDDTIGPEAGAPRTLGEVLLPAMSSPPAREIIVFLPKIPDELFPPIYESDLASMRGGGR
jgi:hypothetical protein